MDEVYRKRDYAGRNEQGADAWNGRHSFPLDAILTGFNEVRRRTVLTRHPHTGLDLHLTRVTAYKDFVELEGIGASSSRDGSIRLAYLNFLRKTGEAKTSESGQPYGWGV